MAKKTSKDAAAKAEKKLAKATKALKAERAALRKAVAAAEAAAARAEKAADKARQQARKARAAGSRPADHDDAPPASDAGAAPVAVPDPAAPAPAPPAADDPHTGLTRAQLIVLAGERGVANRSRMTKLQLLDVLRQD